MFDIERFHFIFIPSYHIKYLAYLQILIFSFSSGPSLTLLLGPE